MGFDNNKIILSLETEKKNWNGKKVRKIPPPPVNRRNCAATENSI